MDTMRKRKLFNVVGGCVIVAWLLMIGMLVRSNFIKSEEQNDFNTDEAGKIASSQHDWMEIYLNGKKVGYAVSHVSPVKEEYLIQENIYLKLNLLGQASAIRTVTQSVADNQFRLKSFFFRMNSGVVSFRVSGRIDGNRMLLKIGEGFGKKKETIVLAENPVIGSGIAPYFKG